VDVIIDHRSKPGWANRLFPGSPAIVQISPRRRTGEMYESRARNRDPMAGKARPVGSVMQKPRRRGREDPSGRFTAFHACKKQRHCPAPTSSPASVLRPILWQDTGRRYRRLSVRLARAAHCGTGGPLASPRDQWRD